MWRSIAEWRVALNCVSFGGGLTVSLRNQIRGKYNFGNFERRSSFPWCGWPVASVLDFVDIFCGIIRFGLLEYQNLTLVCVQQPACTPVAAAPLTTTIAVVQVGGTVIQNSVQTDAGGRGISRDFSTDIETHLPAAPCLRVPLSHASLPTSCRQPLTPLTPISNGKGPRREAARCDAGLTVAKGVSAENGCKSDDHVRTRHTRQCSAAALLHLRG